MESENDDKEISNANTPSDEMPSAVAAEQMPSQSQSQPQQHQQSTDYDELTMNLINNDMDMSQDHDVKIKQRRYWLPKEEERFFQVWGRDNWRLTKHGKNTIFFAQWSEELKDKYNIDVKLEEIQCKVNQTRAKFRQVKKQLEHGKSVSVWKKYHIVEKILKNQYRSKDDEPIPPQALENNRDVSPTELLNTNTGSTSPSTSITSTTTATAQLDQNINIPQVVDQPSGDDVNMTNVSLNEPNLGAIATYSTELFSDDIDIKAEIEEDLRKEEEFINEYNNASYSNAGYQATDLNATSYRQSNVVVPPGDLLQYQQQYVNQIQDNHQPPPEQQQQQPQAQNYNHLIPSSTDSTNHVTADAPAVANYNSNMAMQPPRMISTNTSTNTSTTPARKRNRSHSNHQQNGAVADNLESMYMEEVRRKNAILSEQSDISRKRLALEQRKLNLMEEFFPKYLKLQEQILQKLETSQSSSSTCSEAINVRIEE